MRVGRVFFVHGSGARGGIRRVRELGARVVYPLGVLGMAFWCRIVIIVLVEKRGCGGPP